MSEIIGTSTQVVDEYVRAAEQIFQRIRERMQLMVTRAFTLTYEGPDAELQFNPGMIKMAITSVGQMDEAMVSFAAALSQVTTNISRSLGGEGITLAYSPRPLELPAPPGVAADDYRIDVTAFDQFVATELPDVRSAVGGLIDENQQAFVAMPRATVDQRGWSGQAREHAQNVIVPNQSDQLRMILTQVVEQVSTFLTSARNAVVSADQAGVS